MSSSEIKRIARWSYTDTDRLCCHLCFEYHNSIIFMKERMHHDDGITSFSINIKSHQEHPKRICLLSQVYWIWGGLPNSIFFMVSVHNKCKLFKPSLGASTKYVTSQQNTLINLWNLMVMVVVSENLRCTSLWLVLRDIFLLIDICRSLWDIGLTDTFFTAPIKL